jgi:hypothetical protein
LPTIRQSIGTATAKQALSQRHDSVPYHVGSLIWNSKLPSNVIISTSLESTVEIDLTIQDLAELHASWQKLGTIAAHKEWSREIESYIASGTPRWDVFRIVD